MDSVVKSHQKTICFTSRHSRLFLSERRKIGRYKKHNDMDCFRLVVLDLCRKNIETIQPLCGQIPKPPPVSEPLQKCRFLLCLNVLSIFQGALYVIVFLLVFSLVSVVFLLADFVPCLFFHSFGCFFPLPHLSENLVIEQFRGPSYTSGNPSF